MNYVYMLTNSKNSVLYIGVTNSLSRRLYEHQQDVVDGFAKQYPLHKLVYFEQYPCMVDAISREKQLKRWTRAKKNALIEQMNPAWEDLSEVVFGNAFVPHTHPMILLETDLSFDEETLAALLDALPPSWRARAERYKPAETRLRSAIGYTLLARILQDTYGITDLPAIESDATGKPHLVGCPLYFSISHCKAAVACIVEPHPVGIDVQDILTDISPALAARIAGEPNTGLSANELTVLWTQKEASAKLDGRGLTLGIDSLPLPNHKLCLQEYDTFVLCIARE